MITWKEGEVTFSLFFFFNFSDAVFCKYVLERQHNTRPGNGTLSDISDGIGYRKLIDIPKIHESERKLTFTLNTGNYFSFSFFIMAYMYLFPI